MCAFVRGVCGVCVGRVIVCGVCVCLCDVRLCVQCAYVFVRMKGVLVCV